MKDFLAIQPGFDGPGVPKIIVHGLGNEQEIRLTPHLLTAFYQAGVGSLKDLTYLGITTQSSPCIPRLKHGGAMLCTGGTAGPADSRPDLIDTAHPSNQEDTRQLVPHHHYLIPAFVPCQFENAHHSLEQLRSLSI
jgi:hypothetical protein